MQGSDVKNRDEGWLVGVKRGWRRKRITGKCITRPHVPESGWASGSEALTKVGDLLQALLMVWSVSEKNVTRKIHRKSHRQWVFSDDDLTNQKAFGDGEGDQNETRSPEGFPELMTQGNWKELGFLPWLWYHVERKRKKNLNSHSLCLTTYNWEIYIQG